MPIKNASAEQIEALKNRINQKRNDRIYEAQMDEVVKMVGKKRPFVEAPKENTAEKVVEAIAFLAIAAFGALLWNVTSSVFGLLLFGTASWMALQ